MNAPFDPSEWVSPERVPDLTHGLVSETKAKRDFRLRRVNGLEEAGAAIKSGRKALLHFPTYAKHVFGPPAGVA
jgi:hypothetical protein